MKKCSSQPPGYNPEVLWLSDSYNIFHSSTRKTEVSTNHWHHGCQGTLAGSYIWMKSNFNTNSISSANVKRTIHCVYLVSLGNEPPLNTDKPANLHKLNHDNNASRCYNHLWKNTLERPTQKNGRLSCSSHSVNKSKTLHCGIFSKDRAMDNQLE